MANPATIQSAVTTAMSNLSFQYRNRNLVGNRVFPTVVVPNLSTKILKYSKANMFKHVDSQAFRAEGTDIKTIDWNIEATYANPREIAYQTPVTYELMDNSTREGQLLPQPLIDAVQTLSAYIDNVEEKMVADAIYNNVWLDGVKGGTSKAGVWASSTTATNTFVSDILTAKGVVQKATGVRPNKLVMDYQTFLAISANCGEVKERIKYTQLGVTTEELLAKLLQLDEVIVGDAIFSSQKENKSDTSATFTSQQIWDPTNGKGSAFLFYQDAPGLRSLGAGYQFRLPYRGSLRYVEGYNVPWKQSIFYAMIEQIEVAPMMLDVGYAFTRCIA